MTYFISRPARVPHSELLVYLAYLPTVDLLTRVRELEKRPRSVTDAEDSARWAAITELSRRHPTVDAAVRAWAIGFRPCYTLADTIDRALEGTAVE